MKVLSAILISLLACQNVSSSPLFNVVSGALGLAGNTASGALDLASNTASGALGLAGGLTNGGVATGGSTLDNIFGSVGSIVGSTGQFVDGILQGVEGIVSGVLGNVGEVLEKLKVDLIGNAKYATAAIKEKVKQLIASVEQLQINAQNTLGNLKEQIQINVAEKQKDILELYEDLSERVKNGVAKNTICAKKVGLELSEFKSKNVENVNACGKVAIQVTKDTVKKVQQIASKVALNIKNILKSIFSKNKESDISNVIAGVEEDTEGIAQLISEAGEDLKTCASNAVKSAIEDASSLIQEIENCYTSRTDAV